jgi:hypothetical protein
MSIELCFAVEDYARACNASAIWLGTYINTSDFPFFTINDVSSCSIQSCSCRCDAMERNISRILKLNGHDYKLLPDLRGTASRNRNTLDG